MLLSEVMAEFGVSGPTMLTDLYRGGTNIRESAANNTATHGAANVPTSGALSMSDFYGAFKGWAHEHTGVGTLVYPSAVFGDDWSADWPKTFTVTGTQAQLQIDLNADAFILVNDGEIQGLAGSPSGGDGEWAVYAKSDFTLVNNGAIRGGGGAGGAGGDGGTGGGGSYGYTAQEGPIYSRPSSCVYTIVQANTYFRWGGANVGDYPGNGNVTASSSGGYTYYRGAYVELIYQGGNYHYYQIYRTYPATAYTTGGAGGPGGVGGWGQGYGQASTAGVTGGAGSAGGSYAGTGGTGGTGGAGGSWGSPGADGNVGNTGAAGNYSSGSAGTSGGPGGAAGEAIYKDGGVSITIDTLGTINGAY